MKFSQFSSRRRVFVKRVASVCSISAAALLAGCGSQGISFWDGGSESKDYRAESVPIPSEPIPGHRGGAARAPTAAFQPAVATATSQSSAPAIQRTTLAPVQPAGADAGSGAAVIGGSFAMQAVETAPAKAAAPVQGKRYAQASGGYYDDSDRRYSDGDSDDEAPRKRHERSYGERDGGQDGENVYVVAPGDTMYSVAKRFGLSTGELAELNGISGSTILVGQKLRLRGGPKYTAAHGYDGEPRKAYHSEDDRNGDQASDERKAPPSYGRGPEERSYEEGASHNGRPYRSEKSYAERPSYPDRQPYAERPSYPDRPSYSDRPSHAEREVQAYDERGERPSQGEQPSYQAYREARAYEERREERYEAAGERYEKRRDERSAYARPEDGGVPHTYRKSKGSYHTYSVRQDETLGEIAERHGLSRRELAEYNDIPPSAALYPGQVIRLPKARDYGQGRRPDRYEEGRNDGRRVPYSQNAPASEQGGKLDRRLAKAEPAAVRTEPARVETAKQESKPETRKAEPAPAPRTEPTAAPVAAPAPVDAAPAPMPSAERSNRPILAAHSDVEPAKSEAKPGVPEGKDCEALLSNPVPRSAQTFREPVQGLIVTKFGARNDGTFNDGIDFTVPKGTPVKAAENGVVAYVGNELSGFGNLVLVRHADGYVTAYAHNDEVLVSRCETVKRGQIISKAGASGNVSQPQLHFELRKDSKAVDPEAYFSRS